VRATLAPVPYNVLAMVYFGKVKNGRIELDNGNGIPEGTRVRIEPLVQDEDPADRLGDEAAETGIPDLASEHDHYIYGTPRRAEPRRGS
jgi:hypothetical protein